LLPRSPLTRLRGIFLANGGDADSTLHSISAAAHLEVRRKTKGILDAGFLPTWVQERLHRPWRSVHRGLEH
jgi:hypothetical protein